MTRPAIPAKYIDTLDDPQRAWLERQQAKQRPAAAAQLVDDSPPTVWVHPCGCVSPIEPGRSHPICAVHGQRAVFLGRPGDGYVSGARS